MSQSLESSMKWTFLNSRIQNKNLFKFILNNLFHCQRCTASKSKQFPKANIKTLALRFFSIQTKFILKQFEENRTFPQARTMDKRRNPKKIGRQLEPDVSLPF